MEILTDAHSHTQRGPLSVIPHLLRHSLEAHATAASDAGGGFYVWANFFGQASFPVGGNAFSQFSLTESVSMYV